MKKSILVLFFILLFSALPLNRAEAYMISFKEEYYKLYHIHYQQYPDDCMENIYWLEKAVKSTTQEVLKQKTHNNNLNHKEEKREVFLSI